MSTPVSVEPPPMAHLRTDSEQERDLQVKIQRMITLQHEEQHQSTRSEIDISGTDNDSRLDIANNIDIDIDIDIDTDISEEEEGGDDPRSTIGMMPKRSTTETMSLSAMGGGNNPMGDTISTTGSFQQQHQQRGVQQATTTTTIKAPWPTEHGIIEGLPPPSPSAQHQQAGVGRGTLVFSSNYNPNHRRMSSGDQLQGMMPMSMNSQQQQQQQQQPQAYPPPQIYAGYGALGSSASHPQGAPPHLQEMDQHRGAAPQLQQEHEFHYGNPDFHNPYEIDDPDQKLLQQQQRTYRPEDSICAKFCCLYAPIANLLLQENVHRSFCYGSIDGILTGSGIVSAFCAIEILSIHASWEARLAVVAFTAAACVADAVCMAIGHVWTSFVVSSRHLQERSRERTQLDANKADAKARLVDMLMARGMLKIDAMSLADTLEGYPDMFVSALVGDSLLAGADFAEDETDDGQQQQQPQQARPQRHSFDSWKFPSYGQFNEMDHEPETGNVNMILKESQVEGFFMMLGFVIFAIIPSILWLTLPLLVLPDAQQDAVNNAMETHHAASMGITDDQTTGPPPPSAGQVISLPSLVVSISGIIMWFLGVWKSRFMDSNWIMSGIENAVVLLACVISAYGVGFALCYAFGGDEGLTLSNIVQHI